MKLYLHNPFKTAIGWIVVLFVMGYLISCKTRKGSLETVGYPYPSIYKNVGNVSTDNSIKRYDSIKFTGYYHSETRWNVGQVSRDTSIHKH